MKLSTKILVPTAVGTVLATIGGIFAWKKHKDSKIEASSKEDSPYMNIDREIDLLQDALDQVNEILDKTVQDKSFQERIDDSVNRLIDSLPEDDKNLLEEMSHEIFHETMDLDKDTV